MSDQEPSQKVQIEIENENDEENVETEPPILQNRSSSEKQVQPASPPTQPTVTITRKKITDLTEQERAKLISDAQNGLENEFYNVKLLKNGSTRISLKKQTKAQELIKENESNPERSAPTPTTRYLTDNQLLFEHIINLESQYNKLRAKHKKLKKRYNDLEGYLYADDSDDDAKPQKQTVQQQEQQHDPPIPQVQAVEVPDVPQPQPYVQRRFVRSWRDLRPQ